MSVLINKTLTVGDTGCTLEQIKTNKTNISNLTTTVNGIVTHGSNSNGSYTKFSDGTMICRGSTTITTPAGTGANLTITLPASFINTDYVVNFQLNNGQAYWSYISTNISNYETGKFKFNTWNNGVGQNPNQNFKYVAIGQWK